jgi:hypothetical protein
MTLRRPFMVLVTSLICVGCASTPKSPGPPAEPPPTYQSLAESHNARVAKLQQLYATGSIEFRWKDDKGRHFETGHAELWLSLPRQTALRIDKVGEVLLWLGSDDERYWFFDLLSKETSLRVGRHDEAEVKLDGADGLGMRPLVLLDLLALTPLPVSEADPTVAYAEVQKAWMVHIESTQDGSGTDHVARRVYFDQTSLLPVRVELLNSHGEVALSSSLRRYESVRQAGVSPLAFPKLAKLVDIFQAGDDETDGSIKLALDEGTGIVDDQPLDRVFDVVRLSNALKPQRIDGDLPP